jgi:hypothetical protein
MVSVKGAPPAVAELGDRPLIETAGLAIVKTAEVESPPPGDGVSTLTVAVPGKAMSPAETAAFSVAELTKVVVRAAPFHCTTEDGSKPEPATTSVKPGPPAVAVLGLMPDSWGEGLAATKV